MSRTISLNKQQLEAISEQYPTPFYLYDEEAIRENARYFQSVFSWVPSSTDNHGGFCNYFAVKALPNPTIMQILKEEGMGFDCSSYPELILAERLQHVGENIMFTSNDTPQKEFQKAHELGAIVNFDAINNIDTYFTYLPAPKIASIRYNPGQLKQGNKIIGSPLESKYGCTQEQIIEGYKTLKAHGVQRFALHTMVASNELDYQYFVETAELLLQLRNDIQKQVNVNIEEINLGGGIGIPYQPDQEPVQLQKLSDALLALYKKYAGEPKAGNLRISTENGRTITGPYGYLISRVLHVKHTYKHYVGLDANMANLMRPAMYGAYHHITVAGKTEKPTHTYDITGSLCENNDKFAIDRMLPKIDVGDLLVIHDAGAHGHAMGFNYNGKLRSAELLLHKDGTVSLIRHAETIDNYFSTLVWPS